MRDFIRITLFSWAIFFLSWFISFKVGINDLAIQSEDTLPAMFLPFSILEDKTIYLDKFYAFMIERYPHPDDKKQELGLTPFYLRKIETHYLSAFPLVTGFLAIPIYIFPVLLNLEINWQLLIVLSHIAGALVVALSGGFFNLLVKKHFKTDSKKAFILTIIYLFCSINYALVSQALWQHGALQLFTILSLFMFYEKRHFFGGLFLSIAVLARPTAALFVPFLLLLFVSINLDNLKITSRFLVASLKVLVGMITSILFFSFYTQKFYLDISNNGYSDQILTSWLSRFPEGFLGLWLSPSKGILVYSPVFIFTLVGFYIFIKNKLYRNKEYFIFVITYSIILLHTLIMGRWKHWYGGWSFGYRMASDIIPFLTFGIIPFLNSTYFNKLYKIFLILLFVSFFVQIFGILFFDGIWHAAYDQGFQNTSWLWSIKDSEVIFNIRRILVKLGYLERACPRCL